MIHTNGGIRQCTNSFTIKHLHEQLSQCWGSGLNGCKARHIKEKKKKKGAAKMKFDVSAFSSALHGHENSSSKSPSNGTNKTLSGIEVKTGYSDSPLLNVFTNLCVEDIF